MRTAVLGGGLQGCCIALALAERGANVILYDRNPALLSRTAVANEGKIHLGYMYAADPGFATASMMMQGALAFGPFFKRHLDGAFAPRTSDPAVYAVHRDSQHDAAEVEAYLQGVHARLCEAARGRPDAYLGVDVLRPPRRWSAAEREAEFNDELVTAAFDSPESAIDPVALAALLRERIAADPRIEVRLEHVVTGVEAGDGAPRVRSTAAAGDEEEAYDHVVNALWEGRLALDIAQGLHPPRPWLHRLKYGVTFRQPEILCRRSANIVSGPFGEVVHYGDGHTYLTWYPSCVPEMSQAPTPPEWPSQPDEPAHTEMAAETLRALAEIVLPLRALRLEEMEDVRVKGGVVVAWGETDIDDPGSELHERHRIGVRTSGRYHSVDPGKLTMAPYFADICAERIAGT